MSTHCMRRSESVGQLYSNLTAILILDNATGYIVTTAVGQESRKLHVCIALQLVI